MTRQLVGWTYLRGTYCAQENTLMYPRLILYDIATRCATLKS